LSVAASAGHEEQRCGEEGREVLHARLSRAKVEHDRWFDSTYEEGVRFGFVECIAGWGSNT